MLGKIECGRQTITKWFSLLHRQNKRAGSVQWVTRSYMHSKILDTVDSFGSLYCSSAPCTAAGHGVTYSLGQSLGTNHWVQGRVLGSLSPWINHWVIDAL
jgi:hypothetical protein